MGADHNADSLGME